MNDWQDEPLSFRLNDGPEILASPTAAFNLWMSQAPKNHAEWVVLLMMNTQAQREDEA